MLDITTLGGKYYIDLEKFVGFVSNIEPNERLTNSVITETYGESIEGEIGDMNMMSKEIVETKGTGGGNEFFHDMRFRTLNNLLDLLMKVYTEDGDVFMVDQQDILTIGQKMAFNTLFKYGIIAQYKE